MHLARLFPLAVFLGAAAFGQSADTGTAHKAAPTALLNSNNTGAAHLACPAAIFPGPTANPPDGGPAPPRENWYAEGGQVFDNLYVLTTKMNSAWAVKTSAGIILIDTLFGYAPRTKSWTA